ncbi:MAG: 50S ribosomal protein L25/general stress protein Ctc [Proteobacteria bacterium]|nr:50S ribosomal protein L25/general stress protein Ctc [Pseudomonadota bacterium]
MQIFKVEAELREDVGKGASRRLRHTGKVPVVLYGGDRKPRNLALTHHKVLKLIEDEAFFSSIIEFSADGGKKQQVVLKDMQRHPAKPVIMHMDFMRVDDKHEIVMNIPIHFLGGEDSPAGKSSSVVIDYQMKDVEISCFPKDLPEFIAVDIADFEVGDNLHLSDLKLPKGVTLTAFTHGDVDTYDAVIVSTSKVAKEIDPVDVDAPVATAVDTIADSDAEKSSDSEAKED